ncbi:MAG: GNAT family N-acetyltransferase [Sodalis sp. (in: enterobacteria)]|uniref:GNAT family N-acetyltransferase n=1 Tax=Sodalis sp. (in: enterobacteria) TaxID=1898979 RepID=UPI0039E51248
MSAHASIDLLAWESDFFGRRLGRVVFDDATPRLTPSVLAGFALVQAKVAVQTLVQSRFRAPWFSDEERQRFYAQWVENAVRGSFDHLCLVAQGPDGIAGLVTFRDIGGQAARIGQLAVSPAARGRGTGKFLCRAALGWCRSRGFRQLRVATQTANLPALRLYLASGARVVHASHWLYRGPHDSI